MNHIDVVAALAAANPVPAAVVAGAADSPEAAATLRRILAAPVRSERPAPLPRLRLIAALTAVAAAAALGAFNVVDGDSDFGAEPAAAQALTDAARVAAAAPASAISPGQYYFQRSETVALHTTVVGTDAFSTIVASTREVWFAPDGSGRVRERTERGRLAGTRDRAVWERVGRPALGEDRSVDRSYGAGGSSGGRIAEAEILGLGAQPVDPERILTMVSTEVAAKGQPDDVGGLAFRALADLLANPAATPELRATLFEAMARIDGVQLIGRATDGARRTGVGLGLESAFSGTPSRYVVVFDPTTSRLLESRVVLLKPVPYADVAPPTVISSTLYHQTAIVDSTQERPAE